MGKLWFDTTERESRHLPAVPLMLGRIWPTKMEVKGNPGKEISRNDRVQNGAEHSPWDLRHRMPTQKFCEMGPR